MVNNPVPYSEVHGFRLWLANILSTVVAFLIPPRNTLGEKNRRKLIK
jgi:hypothetical protein